MMYQFPSGLSPWTCSGPAWSKPFAAQGVHLWQRLQHHGGDRAVELPGSLLVKLRVHDIHEVGQRRLGIFPLISAEIESGRLVCPFDIAYHPTRAYYLLTRPGGSGSAEVKVVCEWIESEALLMP